AYRPILTHFDGSSGLCTVGTRVSAPTADHGGASSACGNGGTSAAAAQRADLLQPLGQDVVQLGHAATLQQHVPVGARWLGLLLFRLAAVDEARDAAVELALPGDRHLGVDGERHLELVALRAQVLPGLAGSQLGVAVGLVANGSEAA